MPAPQPLFVLTPPNALSSGGGSVHAEVQQAVPVYVIAPGSLKQGELIPATQAQGKGKGKGKGQEQEQVQEGIKGGHSGNDNGLGKKPSLRPLSIPPFRSRSNRQIF